MAASNVCQACGAVNAAANLFCVNCGSRLNPTPAVAAPAPAYPSAVPPGYPAPAVAFPYFPPPPRRATFSTILSSLFDVWTKNFLNFFVVFLVLALVNGLISGLLAFAIIGTFAPGSGIFPGFSEAAITPGRLGALLLFAIASVVATAILNSIVTGGMTEYAVRRYRGEAIPLERAIRRGFERFLSILGANVLLTLLLFALVALPLLLILPVFTGSGVDQFAAAALVCGGLLAFAVGGVVALYVYIAMSLYAPAIMMENKRAVDGLMRSWRMTKGYRWSIFGAMLVAGILVIIISVVISLPAAATGNPFVSIAATAIASGVVGSWFVILVGVAYELIVRQPTFGAPYFPGPTPSPPVGAAPSSPPPPGLPPPPGP